MSRVRFMFATLFLSCCVWCHSGYATTINAASCSQADVQTAINSASDGDTVAIPACSNTTWTSPALLQSGTCKSITLQGAGVGVTNIIAKPGTGYGNYGVWIDACQNKTIRITGFTLDNYLTDSWGLIFVNYAAGSTLRVDHMAFGIAAGGSAGRAISINGHTYGVADHNTFTGMGYIVKDTITGEMHVGDTSWTQPMPYGTANAFYFEDNAFTFTVDTDMDCAEGGRVIFRQNTVSGSTVGAHGYDSVDNSCLELDAYNNTLNGNGTGFIGVQWRGGSGFIYNNLIQGTYMGQRIGLTNYRSEVNGFYGNKGMCNGSQSVDGNTKGQSGWPCHEQPGRGTSNGSYPIYGWNNCITTLDCTPGGADQAAIQTYDPYPGAPDYITTSPWHIQANRDWYDAVASFNGTAGVGQGLLSARPGTCTTGVAYWDTGANVLYKCSSTNTWTTYYTPYTYPHPLQGAPTGLTATVN